MPKRRGLSWSLGALMCAGASFAAAQGLPAALRACALEREDARRLSCYDWEIAAALAASPAKASQAPAQPTLSAEERFGVRGDLARKIDEQKGIERPPELEQLAAHISGISNRPHGELVFQLDNGQVWEQTELKSGFYVRAGESVNITPGALGSFWLASESGRKIRVKRVR